MNQDLLKNNYIKVPKFISESRAKTLRTNFTDYVKKNNLKGDGQAPNSYSSYNYKEFLELLCEKVLELSKIAETTLLPTYTYARVYGEKSVLEKHVDRQACEISITLHLGGDTQWPIYVEKPNGEPAKLDLEPGDAMIYLGCSAPHWRDEFAGKEYCQAFLHYVQSNGPFAWACFDKVR
jgi:hypothetical protein